MRLLHISDLHIGKRLKGFSLLDDQKYILNQIIQTIKEKKIDGLIIAGDIYDSSTPSNEAVNCFDEFISKIHSLNISCYSVSGNHDSIYRVAFGSNIMAVENIYFAKKFSGKIEPIPAGKNIDVWLVPFIRPYDIREYYDNFTIGSYNEMMQIVVDKMNVDSKKSNILVAHQFVTIGAKSPELSESETVSLGTLDNIDASIFEKFDYVALGHIHKPQYMVEGKIRYCGSPLKYSFSEKNDKKSMVLLDISNKKIQIDFIPYKPLHDMKEITGYFEELLKYPKNSDYTRIVLKDENYITDVKRKLENNFTNIMEISYDNKYTKENKSFRHIKTLKKQSPIELFEKFYELQNNRKLDCEQIKIVQEVFKNIEEVS